MGINLKNVVVSTAVATVLTGLVFTNVNAITATATYGTATTTYIRNGVEVSTTNTNSPEQVKTVTNLDLWLEKLAEKESNHRERIKVLDVNGRYSYGCLQFQMATFQSYSQRYGLVDPAEVESWEELLYDCSLQKQIAKRMIQEKPSNWRHWGYTVLKKGVGLPPATEEPVEQLAVAQ